MLGLQIVEFVLNLSTGQSSFIPSHLNRIIFLFFFLFKKILFSKKQLIYISTISQMPALGRQTAFDFWSSSHVFLIPSHNSGWSQSPFDPRQTITKNDDYFILKKNSKNFLVKFQKTDLTNTEISNFISRTKWRYSITSFKSKISKINFIYCKETKKKIYCSSTSHGPFWARHVAPALPAECSHFILIHSSLVHGLPSSHAAALIQLPFFIKKKSKFWNWMIRKNKENAHKLNFRQYKCHCRCMCRQQCNCFRCRTTNRAAETCLADNRPSCLCLQRKLRNTSNITTENWWLRACFLNVALIWDNCWPTNGSKLCFFFFEQKKVIENKFKMKNHIPEQIDQKDKLHLMKNIVLVHHTYHFYLLYIILFFKRKHNFFLKQASKHTTNG